MGPVDSIQADKAFAEMPFGVKNRWIGGGLDRSLVKDFYAGCLEDDTRTEGATCGRTGGGATFPASSR